MRSEDERRELLERAQEIQALTSTPAWAVLVDFVNTKRSAIQQKIIIGMEPDEYLKAVEWLKGADYVVRASEYLNAQLEADTLARGELQDA